MLHKVSERVIAYAIKNDMLSADKSKEYIYGLEISISVIISCLSVIMIGVVMGMIWQAVLFLLLFASVRRFAGGLHFASQGMCYAVTCIIAAAVLTVIKYSENNAMTYSVVMGLSTLILLVIVPVPAVEKPLDEQEEMMYGMVSRIILIAVAGVYEICFSYRFLYTAKIISVTTCTIAVLALLGKIKYVLYERKSQTVKT